ncbi:MFS transporter [Acidipropionibacterium jensenii]|uniref:MFS transporter n=2 Tax=Acidipropionibacterium jensenii TaxID=1749 RepID=UPI0026476ABE|nr:MFS transporter [Acidipropionibacterium jensenii]MDN6020716.1 MFS transporter [Acidipropionibacterium jensenii]MDN6427053.1 MFS transporter [Acidipropionibacterium jensenii]MDN6513014.1 MFS transporter [Acidipropionibacterium jensenii]MDN6592199.1 MFS transporter [Acidipropionibacterium jensenii]MDN6624803.1 MFS transporter [Acidipropionibacterium jensenii]
MSKVNPAVWAVTVACAFSYMGIGLVDPILPSISRSLNASPGQTELLFTTYLFVSAIVMFFASWVSSRIGRKTTLLLGLGIVVAFSTACALASGVNQVIGFRGGWGVGNALFVSTALATVLGAAADPHSAIRLYEGALGAGMALGPLVGGLLGGISWRGPFAGTAVLMGVGLLLIALLVPRPAASTRPPSPVSAPFRALGDPRLRVLMIAAVVYNYGYFTLLAYAPFPLEAASATAGRTFTPLDLGLVFFGWGLLLALGSVWGAGRLSQRYGTRHTLVVMLIGLTVVEVALAVSLNLAVQVVGVIIGGGMIGILNTLMTELAMSASDLPSDVVSSSYSGARFIGGAIAPAMTGTLSAMWGVGGPYWIGAVCLLATVWLLWLDHRAVVSRVAAL